MQTARMIVDHDYIIDRSTDYTDVPNLDAIPVLNDNGCVTVFAINRSPDEPLPLSVALSGFKDSYAVEEVIDLSHPDPKATNTEDNPDIVRPQQAEPRLRTACCAPISRPFPGMCFD